MAKRSPESVQAKLIKRFDVTPTEARFLWEWHNSVKLGRDKPSQGEVYKSVSKAGTLSSAASLASKALKKDNVRAALSSLQIPREEKTKDKRTKALKRYGARVTSSLKSYLEVREFNPNRANLMALFDSIPFDKDLYAAIRDELGGVRFKDFDELTNEEWENIQSIKQHKNGAIEIKLEPKAPFERLLQDAEGWAASKEIVVKQVVETELASIMAAVKKGDEKRSAKGDPEILAFLRSDLASMEPD